MSNDLSLLDLVLPMCTHPLCLPRQLCERQIEALEEAKRKEKARSFSCRVTIVEPDSGRGVAGAGGIGATRERHGLGYFTLDEDF